MWPFDPAAESGGATEVPRVVYTRGQGCAELAELLGSEPQRVVGNLDNACLEARADLLVTRRPPGGFSLVSVASPVNLDLEGVSTVVAAIAGGPHSPFNVLFSRLVAERLRVELIIANAFASSEQQRDADELLERLGESAPAAKRISIQTGDPSEFIRSFPSDSLLVLGEPGGSLLSRILFGPGARIRARAEGGSVIVRAAPTRVFQAMEEPLFVSPLHLAGDVLLLHQESRVAVVENAHLIGLVEFEAIRKAPGDTSVANLMTAPVAVGADMSLVEAATTIAAAGFEPMGPWPVTDRDQTLIGTYRPQ